MIEVDPTKRISARDAMNHPWIKEAEEFHRQHTHQLDAAEQEEMSHKIVENLKNYRGESILKKAAMNVLVKHLGPK